MHPSWQSKVVRHADVAPADLLAHPDNVTIHTVEQQADTALYIHLGTVKNSAGLYSYGLSLQLLQLVLLFRDPSLVTWGTTWSLDQVGSIASANIEEVESLIARGVNAFIEDYQMANPTAG